MDLSAYQTAVKARVARNQSTLFKPTAPQKEGWNDAVLADLRQGLHFNRSAYNRANLPRVLTRFYNLYLKGVVNPRDNLSSIVFDMIALSRAEGDPIWPLENQGNEGFYPENTSEETALSALELGNLPGVAILNPEWNEAARAQYRALMSQYTANVMADFARYVTQIIQAINPVEGATAEEVSLVRLSSFLALTLLRFATKTKEQMGNAFLKNQYRGNLTSIALWNPGLPFAPPCTRCLEMCELALKKGVHTTSQIFKIIAHEFVLTNRADYRDGSVMGFLSASVLTHTARNGLGMIQMLDHVMGITSRMWHEVMDLSLFGVTKQAWMVIDSFFDSQCDHTNIQYSFNWARIIDHGYFRGLSPKEHPFLATIFGSIIAQIQGPGVWDAEWAKTRGDIPDAKIIGLAIYRKTRPEMAQMEAAESSRGVLEMALQLQGAHRQQNGHLDVATAVDW